MKRIRKTRDEVYNPAFIDEGIMASTKLLSELHALLKARADAKRRQAIEYLLAY
jgi:hypothetical protein